MERVWEIIREFVELIEVLVFIFLFLNVKINTKKKNILLAVAIAFIICFLRIFNVWNDENHLVLLYEVLDFIIMMLLIKSYKFKKIIVYIFSYICTGTINIFVLWINSHFIDKPSNTLLENNILRIITYLSISVIFILINVLLKKRKNKEKLEISTKSFVLSSVILFITIYYSGKFLFLDTEEKLITEILSGRVKILIGAVMLFAYTLCILFLIEERKSDKEKLFLRDELIKLQKKYYLELKDKQQELGEARHDMKAHFLQVTQLYKNGSINEFENYLKKLEKQWNYEKFLTINTNNHTADIIINYYANLAKKSNIVFQCNGYFLDHLLIDEYDLCSLMFNGISNAYEACILNNMSDNKIRVEIKNFNKILFLTISNSYAHDKEMKFDWSTKKNNKNQHGFGINLLTKNVEKYNGNIKYSMELKILYLEIIIPDIYQTIGSSCE